MYMIRFQSVPAWKQILHVSLHYAMLWTILKCR